MPRLVSKRLAFLITVLLILEYFFSSISLPFGARIDFLFLLILDCAFFGEWERVPFLALTVGLVRDFAGGHLFGIQTLSLTLTGLLLYGGVQKLERDNLWVQMAVSLCFIVLTEILSISMGRGMEASKGLSFELIGSIFWTTLITGMLARPFFWFSNRWFQRTPFLKQYELF